MVEKITDDTLTIKTEDSNSVDVGISADTRFLKSQQASKDDIAPGKTLIPSGTREGNTFQATRVQIVSMDAP